MSDTASFLLILAGVLFPFVAMPLMWRRMKRVRAGLCGAAAGAAPGALAGAARTRRRADPRPLERSERGADRPRRPRHPVALAGLAGEITARKPNSDLERSWL